MKRATIIISVFILLAISGLVLYVNSSSFLNLEQIFIGQWQNNQMTNTKFASNQIENHISRVKNELITLSKFPVIDSVNINKCTEDLNIVHERVDGRINSLLRADKEGNIIECSTPRFGNYVGLNINNKEYFSVPKETKEAYVYGPVRDGSSLQIIISVPLFKTSSYTPYPNFLEEFTGVLLSIIEVNDLYYQYAHPLLDAEKSTFMILNIKNNETIMSNIDINEVRNSITGMFYSSINYNNIERIQGFGESVITSSIINVGSDTWRMIIITPIKNISSSFSSMRIVPIISLGLILTVIVSIMIIAILLSKNKQTQPGNKIKSEKVDLKKMGINVGTEKGKYNQAELTIKKRGVYLIKDDDNQAHEIFISTLNSGFAGLGIIRDDPRNFIKKYGLTNTAFLWMTNNTVKTIACEIDVAKIFNIISEFSKKTKKSVILIDRLDYLISQNHFSGVLKMISSLKDLTLDGQTIIILSLNPETINKTELRLIEAETIDLLDKDLKKGIELSELEYEILKLINERNVKNRLVSFKDITNNFKITKPTTRSKVNKLLSKGLINVEQNGRVKSIKITSAGRRMII